MNDTEQEDACTQQHNAGTMLKRLPLLGAKPNPAVAVNGTPPLIKGWFNRLGLGLGLGRNHDATAEYAPC